MEEKIVNKKTKPKRVKHKAIKPHKPNFYDRITQKAEKKKQSMKKTLLIAVAVIEFLVLAGLVAYKTYQRSQLEKEILKIEDTMYAGEDYARSIITNVYNNVTFQIDDETALVEAYRKFYTSYPKIGTKLFEDVIEQLTDTMELEDYQMSNQQGIVTVSVVCTDVDDITAFIRNLKATEYFDRVEYEGYTSDVSAEDSTAYEYRLDVTMHVKPVYADDEFLDFMSVDEEFESYESYEEESYEEE